MIKKILKSSLYYLTTMSSDEIIRKIQNFSCVSFDIFDTLIKRRVARPTDVFLHMIWSFNYKHKKNIDAYQFRDDRKHAATLAMQKATTEGREEITLVEIYEFLAEKYFDYSKLKEEEIESELSVCHVDPVLKKVFDWCIANNKKIFLISDMYLPIEVIRNIVKRCGYSGYNKIYISSDVGYKKSNGSLYEYVLKENNLVIDDWIHIGDNYKSDYLQAKKVNISTILISGNPNRTKFYRKIRGNIALEDLKIISNGFVDESWSLYYQYGFEVLGPLIFGFTKWLHNNAVEEGVNKLLFLSRDGLLLQQAYNVLYGNIAIENKYFYVSRNALTKALIWKTPSLGELLKNSSRGHWNYQMLCERLGIDKDIGLAEWKRHGLYEDERLTSKELINDNRVVNFFEKFKSKVVDKSIVQYKYLKKYLCQEIYGKVGFVDVGWAGTIQKCIDDIIEFENLGYLTSGYYISVNKKTFKEIVAIPFIPRGENVANYTGGLVEFPFTSLDGSTDTYEEDRDGKIIPILKDNEYTSTNSNNELIAVKELQEGALAFLKCMLPVRDIVNLNWETAYNNLKLATKSPRLVEIRMFGELLFYNDYMMKLASPKKRTFYFLHPSCIYKDLSSTGWKHGFLKKLMLIPFPYDKCIEVMARKGNK